MELIDICKICLKEKVLSFEHFPPRSAFNKTTRFYSFPAEDYYENFSSYLNGSKLRPKVKLRQGGLGNYCLCKECNSFLGFKYVNDYVNFAKICYTIINTTDEFKAIEFKIKRKEVNLKNLLKQITSIFICNNEAWFSESYPELLRFVTDENFIDLPEKFRFYMYLNDEGQVKNGHWTFDNVNGGICEFVFPPFGFVLNIENKNRIMELTEITNFKNYHNYTNDEVYLILNKYPTYSPIPLDFRDRDAFNKN